MQQVFGPELPGGAATVQRAYGLADATRKATGWKKFTEGAKQTLEDIGNFFKDVAQFLRDLFSKWFGGNNADTEPAK